MTLAGLFTRHVCRVTFRDLMTHARLVDEALHTFFDSPIGRGATVWQVQQITALPWLRGAAVPTHNGLTRLLQWLRDPQHAAPIEQLTDRLHGVDPVPRREQKA